MSGLSIEISDELVDALAARVLDRLPDRAAAAADDGYLDVAGAAEFLACPTSRIYAFASCKPPRIPVERDGSRLLFDRAKLRAWVEAGGAKRP